MAKETITKEVIIEVQTNAQDASIQIDNLTKKLEDNKEATDEAKESTEKLEKAQKDLDKETGDLTKTIADNSLVTQGLDKVTGGLYSTFKDGIQQVGNLITGIRSYSSAQATASSTTKVTTTAVKGFGKAIVSTGIGVLVVGIGMLISEFNVLDKVMKAFGGGRKDAKDRISDLIKSYDESAQAIRDFGKQYGLTEDEISKRLIENEELRQEAITKLRGEAAEETVKKQEGMWRTLTDLSERAFKNLYKGPFNDEVVKNEQWLQKEIEFINAKLVGSAEMTASKLKVIEEQEAMASRDKQRRLEEEQRRLEVINRRRELEEGFAIEQQEKFNAEFVKIENSRLDELKSNSILFGQELIDANNRTNAFSREEKKILKEREDLWKQFNENFLGDPDIRQENIDLLEEQGAEALKSIQETYQKVMDIPEVQMALDAIAEDFQKRQDILMNHQTQWMDILETTSRMEFDLVYEQTNRRLDLEEATRIKELDDLEATEEQKQQIRAYYNDKRVALEENSAIALQAIRDKEVAGQLAMADGISGILSGLSDASKEGSGIQKGLAIASVALDTGVAAISAFRGMVATFPGPQGVALGTVASAGIALQGLNQINQIKKIKTDGTETGGSASASMSATAVPNVSFMSSSDNQIANTVAESSGNQNTEPIKAYVVSSDVSTAQQLDRNAIESSSL